MTAGEIALKFLKKRLLKVDKKWQHDLPLGYRWFPNQFSQDIEIIGEEGGPDNEKTQFIRIKTEVLEGVELNPKNLEIISELLYTSTMFGPIHEGGKISLCTNIRIHDGILDWMPLLLAQAAILQLAEANHTIPHLAMAMGQDVKVPYKEHPLSGPRLLPSPVIEDSILLTREMGQKPSRWKEEEFQNAAHDYMIQPPSVGTLTDHNGLTVVFPYGDFTSICKMTNMQSHPRIGTGLMIAQKFPVENIPLHEGIKLSLELNKKELNTKPKGYGFGSYCYRNGLLSHVCFIPNNSYKPGLLPNFYYSCAERARSKSIELTNQNWV